MIRLERVTKTVTSGAERLTIVDNVDLFIPAGQFVAITGPSRTGDIEGTLVLGVHGPGDLHVIVIG